MKRWWWHSNCLVIILLRNLTFLTLTFLRCLQSMPALGIMVIFIEFPMMHWHFDLVLNASVLTAQVLMRVYMFHSYQFHAPVMSPFFHPMIHMMTSPWMTYIHVSTRRSTPLMGSLTRTPSWHRLFLWIPIPRSHPTRPTLWSLTLWSCLTPQWFAWLRILPLLLLA